MGNFEEDQPTYGPPKFLVAFRSALIDEQVWTHASTTYSWVKVFRKTSKTTNAVFQAAMSGRQTHVVTIQGTRCRDDQEFLRGWGDALEFPWYYGKNWDAFDECFRDLFELRDGGLGSEFADRPGRPVEQFVVCIDRSEEMLSVADGVPGGGLFSFLERSWQKSRVPKCDLYVVLFAGPDSTPEDVKSHFGI